MSNDNNDINDEHTNGSPDPQDIEELFAEARRDYHPTPQERWTFTVDLARTMLWMLPGCRVTSGDPRRIPGPVDYITPSPNAPLTVFGPDGRFIVSFLADGTWIEADGRIRSAAGVLEGGPEALIGSILRTAGIDQRRRQPRNSQTRPTTRQQPTPHDHGLPRLLIPKPTRTWRDTVTLPAGQTWDEHTPASICRESVASRLVLAGYDPTSCTFAKSDHPRWGIESVRIRTFPEDSHFTSWRPAVDQVRVGDCLITVGRKVATPEDEIEYADDFEGVRIWHPQRVVRVEPEGADHLRVWLAWDDDVKNDNATSQETNVSLEGIELGPRILDPQESKQVLKHFHLDVFCPQCGKRAKPIVYGMPTSADPSYLAIGGCVIEPNQPRYTCYCGHLWTDRTNNDDEGDHLDH